MIGRWKPFASFFRVLNLVRVRWEGEDKLWWGPSKKGLFGVKSFYSVMCCHDCVFFLGKMFGRLRFR
jgi:hypothetical protein